jgi:hypothetical protein
MSVRIVAADGRLIGGKRRLSGQMGLPVSKLHRTDCFEANRFPQINGSVYVQPALLVLEVFIVAVVESRREEAATGQ